MFAHNPLESHSFPARTSCFFPNSFTRLSLYSYKLKTPIVSSMYINILVMPCKCIDFHLFYSCMLCSCPFVNPPALLPHLFQPSTLYPQPHTSTPFWSQK